MYFLVQDTKKEYFLNFVSIKLEKMPHFLTPTPPTLLRRTLSAKRRNRCWWGRRQGSRGNREAASCEILVRSRETRRGMG